MQIDTQLLLTFKTSTFMWFNLILSLKGKTKLTTLPVLREPILILDDCHKMLKDYCLAIFSSIVLYSSLVYNFLEFTF